MLFVKVDDLKPGMRLARPIYNRNGVLLYGRDTKLPVQGIYNIKNFGLIGLYILEPAEPLPYLSDEDIEFDIFQTTAVFSIKEDFETILTRKNPKNLNKLVLDIARRYGSVDEKINFFQNLRTKEDYMYKHALNTAILGALITRKMNLSRITQSEVITAALLHSLGEMLIPDVIKEKTELSDKEELIIKRAYVDAFALLNHTDVIVEIKNIIQQEYTGNAMNLAAKILKVASDFDNMTAMNLGHEPISEVAAIKSLLDNEELYDAKIVEALINSINILQAGTCVELSTKEKALVISENDVDILRPMVLSFDNNTIYDLALPSVYEKVQIHDIMKTMDNRIIMDNETLAKYKK